MFEVGFLKFLRKEKDKPMNTLDNLDMPPPPPEGMPLESKDDLGPLPQFPEGDDSFSSKEYVTSELGNFEEKMAFSQELARSGDDKPLEIPPFDQPKPTKRLFERPFKQRRENIKPESDYVQQSHYEESQNQAFMEGKDLLEHRKVHKGPIYVKIDRFRNIFDGISDVRALLKKTSDSVQLAMDKEMTKDKDYDRLKGSITDMQKKLLFVEQTIFKR